MKRPKAEAKVLPFPGSGRLLACQATTESGVRVAIELELGPAGPGEEPIPPGMVLRQFRVCRGDRTQSASDRG